LDSGKQLKGASYADKSLRSSGRRLSKCSTGKCGVVADADGGFFARDRWTDVNVPVKVAEGRVPQLFTAN
jgi:hypothetical protein